MHEKLRAALACLGGAALALALGAQFTRAEAQNTESRNTESRTTGDRQAGQRFRDQLAERMRERHAQQVAQADRQGLQRRSVVTPDGQRDYLVFAPPGGSAGRPVVIVLHGGTMNAEAAMTSEYGGIWNDRAGRNRFTVVYPNGSPSRTNPDRRNWNDCRAPSVRPGDGGFDINDPTYSAADDVAFIRMIISDLTTRDQVDAARIYAVGSSNGGFMSFRLLREAGDLIAGIAPLITGSPALDECRLPTIRRPIIFTYGDSDTFIPMRGGCVAGQFNAACGQGRVEPVTQTISYWKRYLGADRETTTKIPDRNRRDSSTQTQTDFVNQEGQVMLRVVRVNGGGHTAPAPDPAPPFAARVFGARNADRPAADYIIDFFGLAR